MTQRMTTHLRLFSSKAKWYLNVTSSYHFLHSIIYGPKYILAIEHQICYGILDPFEEKPYQRIGKQLHVTMTHYTASVLPSGVIYNITKNLTIIILEPFFRVLRCIGCSPLLARKALIKYTLEPSNWVRGIFLLY